MQNVMLQAENDGYLYGTYKTLLVNTGVKNVSLI